MQHYTVHPCRKLPSLGYSFGYSTYLSLLCFPGFMIPAYDQLWLFWRSPEPFACSVMDSAFKYQFCASVCLFILFTHLTALASEPTLPTWHWGVKTRHNSWQLWSVQPNLFISGIFTAKRNILHQSFYISNWFIIYYFPCFTSLTRKMVL